MNETGEAPTAEAGGAYGFIHPPWPGYPLPGCSAAEPDSVSPDKSSIHEESTGKTGPSLGRHPAKMASFCAKLMIGNHITFPRDDAMKEFIQKHQEDTRGVLNGFDRVRFRGTLRSVAVTNMLLRWLNHRHVLLKDFAKFAQGLTAQLKKSVEAVAAAAEKKILYLASSKLSKEDLIRELLRREGLTRGVVAVLSCVESCQTFQIRRNPETKHIDLTSVPSKCLHWYVYFMDAMLGLCHVRIQSWLPFTVHVCVNGREWLCCDLEKAGIGFVRRDNCLVDVDDVAAAQTLLDAQPWARWGDILQGLLERACPAVCQLPAWGGHLERYWSADETEWATDVMFGSPQLLAKLYPLLIHYGICTFSSRDVMRFLGRTRIPRGNGVDVRFNGEVVSDLEYRPEGVRIKHRMNRNSIKMYDKQGSVLRVETTINDARDLGVYRASEAAPDGPKKWQRMRKGVADLPQRAAASQASNNRYLTALAAVDSATPLGQVADQVRLPVVRDGRRARGLHLVSGIDAQVAQAVLHGEFTINGFRNRDLRALLYPASDDPAEQRRQSGKVTRLLRLFVEHGLIRKVKGTHRYHVTAEGRRVLPAFVVARNASTEKLQQLAA
jgi:hypothetical protein